MGSRKGDVIDYCGGAHDGGLCNFVLITDVAKMSWGRVCLDIYFAYSTLIFSAM